MKVKLGARRRAFARGAGTTVTVFPRAKATMTPVTAVSQFSEARNALSRASREAERRFRAEIDLINAE